MTPLTCPACGPAWSGQYTIDHRCADCTTILHAAPGGDAIREQLASEVVRLERELEASDARLEKLLERVRDARNHAGEHLPAASGLGIVHILENAMREARA